MVNLTIKRPTGEPESKNIPIRIGSQSSTNMGEEENSKNRSNGDDNSCDRRDSLTNPHKMSDTYVQKTADIAHCDALIEEILSTYPPSRDWRNAWGISRDLGYSEETVDKVLVSNPDIFELSPIRPAGITLYRPRKA